MADNLVMEQRREPRFTVDQPVAVTLLGEREVRATATVKDASGRGLGLTLTHAVKLGTALKIEIEDAILLGEVVHCQPAEGGGYLIGVELHQALYTTAELRELAKEFVGELPTPVA
ncbi:MAG TPA: PilZ domain-containing protein [Bryobacteraceae bacterium]|nr:PilZ domain-containing protein [Bryobacteraceae bacterium]